MTKTIAELWNGGLIPYERSGRNNPEILQLEKRIRESLDAFLKSGLEDKQRKLFDAYHDCVNEYAGIYAEQGFCDGFCLGVRIAFESLSGAEQFM